MRKNMKEKINNLSIFIFRRDLRLQDNTGLIEALKSSKLVIPIFVFDSKQVSDSNKFKSNNAIQFMIESLDELDKELRNKKSQIYFFNGDPVKVIKKIIKEKTVDAVFVNKDYTPFSVKRDKEIKKVCDKFNIEFLSFNDVLMNDPDSVLNSSGEPYSVYTAYYKNASKNRVKNPVQNKFKNYFKGSLKNSENKTACFTKVLAKENKNIWVHGGRKNFEKIINNLKDFKNYSKTRNLLSLDTTYLSAYIKFGIGSIREVFYAVQGQLGSKHLLLKQLYWHDFYTVVAYFNPYVFGKPFKKKYTKIKWSNSKKNFNSWKDGKTGFPIVDAGIRQLNKTGFMHNRARMVVASFLVKDLHQNWLKGEKYFAQNLVDYDPAVNNGNWQWSASTGCDAQPYFRIFNPWLQQKKFDPECDYIKKWIPELEEVDSKKIHKWEIFCDDFDIDYPGPIVDHKKVSQKSKKLFKDLV
jgi:deoxyribodipyrimidine photo-lyase